MEKTNKYVKKAVRNIKIKRKTGNKPSQISKNRQKCKKKPVENRQKRLKNIEKSSITSKNFKKPSKMSKNNQKFQKP